MSNGEQTTLSAGGPGGLRIKLALGFVGLLAILFAVGSESISLLTRLGGSIDVILRENYKSVIAVEQMKESLERMDSGALFALAGHEPQGDALARENRPKFEAALATELGNITLPGEGERAQRLRQLFTAYAPTLTRVLDPGVPLEERRALYFQKLFPTFQQIKGTADEILQMNQQNMVEANDSARALAARANRRMAVLLLLGTAFAGICIAFLFRSVLAPVERLTRAARLANAARNLETALGPVRSTLDILKSESSPLTPQQELLLEGVRRQAEILDRSAKNLLALSRGEELRQELHPEPTASRELIDAAVQEIAVRYRAKKVELAIDVDPEASRVLADRERVGVVLSALLNNALVHTAAGGKVTVHAEPWEGRARFSVADTGDGIPPAHLERIFEPFYQVPGTEDLGGVGLGLTIAREIVQDHGGEIHGESEGEGRGATFWFTLPAAVS